MKEQELIAKVCKGHQPAINYCNLIFKASQHLDDLVDADKTLTWHQHIHSYWTMMVDLPNNPFFAQHSIELTALHAQYLNDFADSYVMEGYGDSHDQNIAWVLRDSVSTLLIQVARLIGGKEWMFECSMDIREAIFDEPIESYKEGLGIKP